VQRVAQFGRVNCNGSREDAKDAKKTIATYAPISATRRPGTAKYEQRSTKYEGTANIEHRTANGTGLHHVWIPDAPNSTTRSA
jgi:hypothetical protein